MVSESGHFGLLVIEFEELAFREIDVERSDGDEFEEEEQIHDEGHHIILFDVVHESVGSGHIGSLVEYGPVPGPPDQRVEHEPDQKHYLHVSLILLGVARLLHDGHDHVVHVEGHRAAPGHHRKLVTPHSHRLVSQPSLFSFRNIIQIHSTLRQTV